MSRPDRIGSLTVLLSNGVNLGLHKMVHATNKHSFWELLRIARWHVEEYAYTHVSDQFSPFATQAIPATAHEAPYIHDSLLLNDAGHRIEEQYADTSGFSDHVFALCSIFGYCFALRIRDLPAQ